MGILSWLGRGSTKETSERNEAGPSKPNKSTKPPPSSDAPVSHKAAPSPPSRPKVAPQRATPLRARQKTSVRTRTRTDTAEMTHDTRRRQQPPSVAPRSPAGTNKNKPKSGAMNTRKLSFPARASRREPEKREVKEQRRAARADDAKTAAANAKRKSQKAVHQTRHKRRRPSRSPSPSVSSTSSERSEDNAASPSSSLQRSLSAGATAVGGAGAAVGLKRVRSLFRMRPLIFDEKLRVFVEGRDEELLHFDSGEFYEWLKDCEAGSTDAVDNLIYPLVVQDSEFRTIVEVRAPEDRMADVAAKRQRVLGSRIGAASGAGADDAVAGDASIKANGFPTSAAARAAAGGIRVPTFRPLPVKEWPDEMLKAADPRDVPVVQRTSGSAERYAPPLAAANTYRPPGPVPPLKLPGWPAGEAALARDPPFIRYVQPTPDDLDLSIEYDLDEEDEAWLAEYNAVAKRSKSRTGKRPLGEERLEHLIDRLEKEYTAELQRHPEQWVIGRGSGHAGIAHDNGSEPVPTVSVPAIERVLPFEKCLEIPGMDHYETVIRAVYDYWRAKHRRAGRPLIQRLWYEPPWHRGAAARRAAATAAEGDGTGVFVAPDSPIALQGIRKRRMDAAEVRSRFESIRRDLEGVRTLADVVRRREKLKRREAALLAEEWQSRLKDLTAGVSGRVGVKGGKTSIVGMVGPPPPPRPPKVHALLAMERAAAAAQAHAHASYAAAILGFDPYDTGEVMPTAAEDRAARLAARRDARDAAIGGFGLPSRRPASVAGTSHQQSQQHPQQQLLPPVPSLALPLTALTVSAAAARSARTAAAGGGRNHDGNHGGSNNKDRDVVLGPRPAVGVKRDARCVWCGSRGSAGRQLLGCRKCHRCFCSRCFQRRPGYGSNDWHKAVKDDAYECLICRGLESDDDAEEQREREDVDARAEALGGSATGRRRTRERDANRPGTRAKNKAVVGAVHDDGEDPGNVSAAVAARAAAGSKSVREQARAQAAAQPRSASGRFLPFNAAAVASPSVPARRNDVVGVSAGAAGGGASSRREMRKERREAKEEPSDTEDVQSDHVSEDQESETSGVDDGEEPSSSSTDEIESDGLSNAAQEGEETSSSVESGEDEDGDGNDDAVSSESSDASLDAVPAGTHVIDVTRTRSVNTRGGGKENRSPRARSRSTSLAAMDTEAETTAPDTAPGHEGNSDGKKMPRELAALLRRKSRSLLRREAKGISEKATSRTMNGHGVKKPSGSRGNGVDRARLQMDKQRSGTGVSRADIEIVLQQAVTTPSRKLRSSHR